MAWHETRPKGRREPDPAKDKAKAELAAATKDAVTVDALALKTRDKPQEIYRAVKSRKLPCFVVHGVTLVRAEDYAAMKARS